MTITDSNNTSVTEDSKQYMLTTTDNPYNPFTQYDDWYGLDEALGHHTTSRLARYTITSDELSISDQENSVQNAIDDLIRDDPLSVFKKVTKEDYDS